MNIAANMTMTKAKNQARWHRILHEIFIETGFTESYLCNKARTGNLALARNIAWYLARELTSIPSTELGRRLGGRGHDTVAKAWKRIDRYCRTQGGFDYVTGTAFTVSQVKDLVRNIRERVVRSTDGIKTSWID